MRICILTGDIDFRAGKGEIQGGSTRYITNLTAGLRRAGHTVDVAAWEGRYFADFMRVRRYARTHDIVHAINLNPLGFIAYFATRFTKAKLVITVQGSFGVAPLDHKKTAFLSRVVYRATAVIVAISVYIKKEIDRRTSANVVVVTPGVDLSKFKDVASTRSEGKPYLLGVGSIKRRKGYETSLRAFLEAKKEIPDLRYIIVGSQSDEPNYVQKLKTIVREENAAQSVDFIENISDAELLDLYRHASVFILTSTNAGGHFEGFGLVFLEAGACTLPSIGTRGSGIEDAIVDGETGILVSQNDIAATKDAVMRLIKDKELRTRLGNAGRLFAQEHTWEVMIRDYERVYKSVL